MIITRYLIKEILSTLAGVLLVLFLMAVSAQLVGLFGKVAAGTLKVSTVAHLFGLYVLTLLPFIVPLALYLSVLLALTRLYRDSEMAALAACGFGPFQTMRAVLLVALGVAVVQGGFSLFISPWADAQGERLEALSSKTVDIEGVTPGRFRSLPEGKGVIYVESINDDGTEIYNVFASVTVDNRESLLVARSGHIQLAKDGAKRFLVLQQGYRYEGRPGGPDYAVIRFEKHGLQLQESRDVQVNYHHRSISTRDLLKRPETIYKAELQGRISSALLCIVLAMLAVPLARTSHRQGRYAKLAIALVFYLVISNLLNVARTSLIQGEVPIAVGLWWVHGLLVILSIGLIYFQLGAYRRLVGRGR